MTNSKYPKEVEQTIKEQAASQDKHEYNFLNTDQSVDEYVNHLKENGQELIDGYKRSDK